MSACLTGLSQFSFTGFKLFLKRTEFSLRRFKTGLLLQFQCGTDGRVRGPCEPIPAPEMTIS